MKPIKTLHLFPELTDELITLLKSLDSSDWLKPSPIKNRTVKDLVSHLIDGSLRRLAMQRDNFVDETNSQDINSNDELVNFIQTLNTQWISASRRLSPVMLIDFLEYSENSLIHFLKTLNPTDKAFFAVAWAGESESENWFDIAREYTEKWHHQMQIRLALNKPILMEKQYTKPLYDTFMRGLPFLYQDIPYSNEGDTIEILISGELNKKWYLIKQPTKWELLDIINSNIITTHVVIPENIAWLLFTNTDRDKIKYKDKIKIIGNKTYGLKLLEFVAVMS